MTGIRGKYERIHVKQVTQGIRGPDMRRKRTAKKIKFYHGKKLHMTTLIYPYIYCLCVCKERGIKSNHERGRMAEQ